MNEAVMLLKILLNFVFFRVEVSSGTKDIQHALGV
jgi:hypothetical protein